MNKNNKSDNTILCDNVEIYEDRIYMLCDEYINNLHNPEDIYTNKRLVPDLLKYIYKNYIKYLLDNEYHKHKYNILLLDKLFDICSSICHKYNSNINILLFCNMTNINRDSINRWKNNIDRELTPQEHDIVKKWYRESELDLVQGGSVFDIFMLKSNFMYNDNLSSIPLESQGIKQSIEQLPNFALENKDQGDN